MDKAFVGHGGGGMNHDEANGLAAEVKYTEAIQSQGGLPDAARQAKANVSQLVSGGEFGNRVEITPTKQAVDAKLLGCAAVVDNQPWCMALLAWGTPRSAWQGMVGRQR